METSWEVEDFKLNFGHHQGRTSSIWHEGKRELKMAFMSQQKSQLLVLGTEMGASGRAVGPAMARLWDGIGSTP